MRKSQVSVSAIKVARVVASLQYDEVRRGLPPEGASKASEAVLLAAGLMKPWMARLWASPGWKSFVRWVERHTLQGQTAEYGLRKRFIEDETRAAIAAGARQVLVVGAGFDTLCVRLARELPDVLFVETDHPRTHAKKAEALAALGAPANLQLAPLDLEERSLTEVVEATGWQSALPCVVVAEAVFMYLEEVDVARFVDEVHDLVGPGSRLVFTYIPSDEAGRRNLGKRPDLLTRSMKLVGEPLRWAATPRRLAELLEGAGFALDQPDGGVDLGARYQGSLGLADEVVANLEECASATWRPRIAHSRAQEAA